MYGIGGVSFGPRYISDSDKYRGLKTNSDDFTSEPKKRNGAKLLFSSTIRVSSYCALVYEVEIIHQIRLRYYARLLRKVHLYTGS